MKFDEFASSDVLLNILLQLQLADLYLMTCVSEGFCKLARQAIESLYVMQHDGSHFLNYSKILYELDTLVQDAGAGVDVDAASIALQASPRFRCVESVLRAQFGYCIGYAKGKLPKFYLQKASLDILDDKCKSSVVPYMLDRRMSSLPWVQFIQGLVDRGRLELLGELTFPEIYDVAFYELMDFWLPESVVVAAAKALRRNDPASELSNLLALTMFGDQTTTFPVNFEMPLCFLRYLHGRQIDIPDSLVIVDGLADSSVSFWMHLVKMEVAEAKGLLEIVLKNGDGHTKRLASTFYEAVSSDDLLECQYIYQAMLIRLRFSSLCNDQVVQNYESMLGGLSVLCFHTASAFLDCGQAQLIDSYPFTRYDRDRQAIAYKVYQLRNGSSGLLNGKFLTHLRNVPELLRHLIQEKAEDAYVQLSWDFMKTITQPRQIAVHCCRAPADALKRLSSGQYTSMDDICSMLSMLHGFKWQKSMVSREAHVLYTVMFWEAPGEVIDYFLDQLPGACMLEFELVLELLLLPKYSVKLCQKLLRRLTLERSRSLTELAMFRPDLALVLKARG